MNYPPPPEPIRSSRPDAESRSLAYRAAERDSTSPALRASSSVSRASPATAPEMARTVPQTHWQLWLLLIVLLSLALAVLGPVLLGLYTGLQERGDLLHQRAVEHYKQALAYQAENYTELALAELEIAVKFDPNYQPAIQKLAELHVTPTTNGTAVPQGASIADQLFKKAQDAVAQKQWADAIDSLEEIRRADSSYRATEVQSLLLQAYLSGSKQAVADGKIEQARTWSESALELDKSNSDALSIRNRALLYLTGVQAMGSDWQAATLNLQKLYQLDPNFYDVKRQLLNDLIQYGDWAGRSGAYCIAAREYDQAVRLGAPPDAATKLAQANVACRQTVTAPTLTPTPGASGGGTVTRGAYSVSSHIEQGGCQAMGSISGVVRDARGNPLSGVRIRIYNDYDYRPAPFITDAQGKYSIILGADAGLFHLVVLGVANVPASDVFDLNYQGGKSNACRWTVDWTRTE